MTYFLKNVHDRMTITNISIKDSFASHSDFKFEAVHGRQSNLKGGIDRFSGNTYIDSAIREREKLLVEQD